MSIPTATEFSALATLANDITRGIVLPGLPLPPQDMILEARGGDYRWWDWVMTDPLVKACFQQRQRALVARPWVVEAGGTSALDQKAADSLKAQLDHIGWDRVTNLMLNAVMYGFSVAEALYARDGAEVVLEQLLVRRQRRFCFDGTGALRLRTLGAPFGLPLPEEKFWVFSTGADHDDDPYGVGLCSWLLWPVWFRRGGLKAFLHYLEKYAQPTAVGTYPPNASETDKGILYDALLAIASNTVVRLPEGHKIDLIEAKRAGKADYAQLDDLMKDTITLVILSQTMTTHSGSSLSQAKVHEGVKLEVVQSDGELITDSFRNGPAAWLTGWNYPGAAVPIVRRIVEDAPDRAALATTDVALAGIGWRRTEASFLKTFGEGYTYKPPAPSAAPPAPGGGAPADLDPSFAEAPPLRSGPNTGEQYGTLLGAPADGMVRGWLGDVQRVLQENAGLPWGEVARQILALDIDPATLSEIMAEAVMAADVAGRCNAGGEAPGGKESP